MSFVKPCDSSRTGYFDYETLCKSYRGTLGKILSRFLKTIDARIRELHKNTSQNGLEIRWERIDGFPGLLVLHFSGTKVHS